MSEARPSGRWADLGPRIVTAFVLVVIGGFAIWAGSPVFDIFLGLALILLVGEIVRTVRKSATGRDMASFVIGAVGGYLALISSGFLFWLGLAVAVICLIALWMSADKTYRVALIGGVALVTFAVATISELRAGPSGILLTVGLIGIVAATDIGAYLVGRLVGGPKMAPRISPKKTYSGAIGGLLCALVAAVMFGIFTDGLLVPLIVLGFALSVLSMIGDLVQSGVKRRFGVKDSGTILPGHGGVWDRFDGLIGAAIALGVLALFFNIAHWIWSA